MTGERERVVGGAKGLDSPTHERYSVSPVRYESQKLLLSPRKAPRLMSKVPFKVLDAPDLAVRLPFFFDESLRMIRSYSPCLIRTITISTSSTGLRRTFWELD